MDTVTRAAIAGAAGAVATTLLHETTRRRTDRAPRLDLLGMQAFARMLRRAGVEVPDRGALYTLTLAGDLALNAGYFGLAALWPREQVPASSTTLGAVYGLGAVILPPYLELDEQHTDRTAATRALTVALYAAGGLVAGATYRALPD